MSRALVTAEIVIGVCAVLAVVFLVGVYVRRRLLSRGGDLMLCSLRRRSKGPWKPGLLRFDDTSLAWFPLFGVLLRPRYCWERAGIDLGNTSPIDSGQLRLGEHAQAVQVTLTGEPRGGAPRSVEVALAVAPYAALRSWTEASPPSGHPIRW